MIVIMETGSLPHLPDGRSRINAERVILPRYLPGLCMQFYTNQLMYRVRQYDFSGSSRIERRI
ncbi:MAG: hypothetical protein DCF18_05085 [Cyanobium sp.]|nr:MAG: hypothetical protein DCF18_05085 [Cyanobium sp.]